MFLTQIIFCANLYIFCSCCTWVYPSWDKKHVFILVSLEMENILPNFLLWLTQTHLFCGESATPYRSAFVRYSGKTGCHKSHTHTHAHTQHKHITACKHKEFCLVHACCHWSFRITLTFPWKAILVCGVFPPLSELDNFSNFHQKLETTKLFFTTDFCNSLQGSRILKKKLLDVAFYL